MHYRTLLGSVAGIVFVLTALYISLNTGGGTGEYALETVRTESEGEMVMQAAQAGSAVLPQVVGGEDSSVVTLMEEYTLAEVALHRDATSCWTIIEDSVYDLTPFITRHPGGAANILKICGRDGTSAYMGQHGGNGQPRSMLANYHIGAYSN